jgi:hypothetical protein
LLLALLLRFEELFDGMLGDCKLLPVFFKLKDGAKPHHGRLYPIPETMAGLTQSQRSTRLLSRRRLTAWYSKG